METFGSLDSQVQLENHSSSVDYLRQRYACSYENTFNSWNDYLGLSTLVSKAVSQGGKSALHPGAELQLRPGAPCIARSLQLGLCSQHDAALLASDLEGRFAQFSPFSGYPAAGGEQQRPERKPGHWSRLDVIMMDNKSHLQLAHSRHYQQQLHQQQQQPPPAQQRATRGKAELQICVFCRNNNESVTLYTTHVLKSPDGRVLCPILRRYTCPLCGANGDNAHTIKYCPLSKLKSRNCVSKRVR
ncbi:nanos homolog 1-like [Scyliorhinus canicula]|uniref:Nanos1A protein n=1 Tax=Scyliorhinus canicula TaxID=7830 RepID=A0A2S0SZZ6_SCYCA|nr:nanos homolog 1-like [Scyliorhinus canicula]AWB14927.1 Nanos1A protein [Scyliorhinus canicula]AWB14930.1 Nanos1A protein [Scyliorhinus canicula]